MPVGRGRKLQHEIRVPISNNFARRLSALLRMAASIYDICKIVSPLCAFVTIKFTQPLLVCPLFHDTLPLKCGRHIYGSFLSIFFTIFVAFALDMKPLNKLFVSAVSDLVNTQNHQKFRNARRSVCPVPLGQSDAETEVSKERGHRTFPGPLYNRINCTKDCMNELYINLSQGTNSGLGVKEGSEAK